MINSIQLRLKNFVSLTTPAIKDSFLYTTSNYGALILALIGSIIARIHVDPSAFGAIAYAQAFQIYMHQINSILVNAMNRDVPRIITEKDSKKGTYYINNAWSFLIIFVFLQSIGLGIASMLFRDPLVIWAFIVIAAFHLLGQPSNFAKHIFRIRLKYNIYAKFSISNAFFGALTLSILAILYGVVGYYTARVLSSAFSLFFVLIFLSKINQIPKIKKINFKQLKTILISGLPMVLIGLSSKFIQTSSTIFIRHFLSLEALGLFSFALLGLNIMLIFPNSMIGAYLPRFIKKVSTSNKSQIDNVVLKIQRTLIFIMIPLIQAGILLINPFILNILPNYNVVIVPFQIIIISSIPYGFTQLYYNMHVAMDKLKSAVIASILSIPVSAILYWSLTSFGLNMVAVAILTSFLIWAILMYFAARITLKAPINIKNILGGSILLLIFCYFYFFINKYISISVLILTCLWSINNLLVTFKRFGIML